MRRLSQLAAEDLVVERVLTPECTAPDGVVIAGVVVQVDLVREVGHHQHADDEEDREDLEALPLAVELVCVLQELLDGLIELHIYLPSFSDSGLT